MAVTRAAGYPDFSSSSNSKMIQSLWAKKLRNYYYKNDVIPYITNTEAENQSAIKSMGDKVIFRSLPDVSTYDYSKGQTITYSQPIADAIELEIDKAKGFSFSLDAIDKYQTDISYLDELARHGAKILSQDICTAFLADIYDDVHASNQGTSAGAISGNLNLGVSGTPRVLTKDNILFAFSDFAQVLDEQNIPDDGKRHITIPPAIRNLIRASDLKNASFSGESKSTMLGASIGEIAGFKIHVTNNVNSATDGSYKAFDVLFNHQDAIAFCMQITKTRFIAELENTHGSGVSALSVYGYKMIQNVAGAWAYVAVGA